MPYKNKQKQKQYYKEYYKKHPEWRTKYSANWRKKHPEKAKQAIKKWQQKNPEKYKRYQLNSRRRLKLLVLNHYSNNKLQCACCGESIFEFLTIDHINNDGAEHRKNLGITGQRFYRWLKSNNFPEGFQVLCMNCNWSKGQFGFCPHKEPEKSWHPEECKFAEKAK